MSLLAIELLEDVLELLEDLLELSGATADNLWIESSVCIRKFSQVVRTDCEGILASTPWTDCHALRADGTARGSNQDVLSQANLPVARRVAAPNRRSPGSGAEPWT